MNSRTKTLSGWRRRNAGRFSTQLQAQRRSQNHSLGDTNVDECGILTQTLELRTVLLTGDFGTFGETPCRVEVKPTSLLLTGKPRFEHRRQPHRRRRASSRPRTNASEPMAGECPNGT